jgi:hypothetical protein
MCFYGVLMETRIYGELCAYVAVTSVLLLESYIVGNGWANVNGSRESWVVRNRNITRNFMRRRLIEPIRKSINFSTPSGTFFRVQKGI